MTTGVIVTLPSPARPKPRPGEPLGLCVFDVLLLLLLPEELMLKLDVDGNALLVEEGLELLAFPTAFPPLEPAFPEDAAAKAAKSG